MRVGWDTFPGQRRVGEDRAVNLVSKQTLHHGPDVFIVQIRGKLDEDRHRVCETCPCSHNGFEQRIQPVGSLQVAQSWSVRRGNVDREIGGQRPKSVDPRDIVGDRVAAGAIRADVCPEDAARRPARKLDQGGRMASTVEAEPIDDAALAHDPEYTRARISWLRLRRYRARLRKTEADVEQRIVDARVLVVPGGNANGIWKCKTE